MNATTTFYEYLHAWGTKRAEETGAEHPIYPSLKEYAELYREFYGHAPAEPPTAEHVATYIRECYGYQVTGADLIRRTA